MARIRRIILANTFYEIVIRTKAGLPFPPWHTINLLLLSAMARALRNQGVILCGYTWMGNHCHLLLIAKDATECVKFYMEIQKKTTEYIKRLRGHDHLQLWEGRASVIAILDLNAAAERMRYVFCNPMQANLVEQAEQYPGLSTWKDFCEASASIHTKVVQEVPWIRFSQVARLRTNSLCEEEDLRIENQLRGGAEISHELAIFPFAWMNCFGVSELSDVEKVRCDIVRQVRNTEVFLVEQRRCSHVNVLGAAKLRQRGIGASHRPKKRDRVIFVISTIPRLRMTFIEQFKKMRKLCVKLYEEVKQGAFVRWPPSVFPAAPPLVANGLWLEP